MLVAIGRPDALEPLEARSSRVAGAGRRERRRLLADPLGGCGRSSRASPSPLRGESAATGGAPAPPGLQVERPKRAGQGDYSTNVAMLLAPALGGTPREIAERSAPRWRPSSARISSASRSPGRASSTCTMSDGWYRRALAACSAPGRRSAAAGARAGPSGCCWSSSRRTRPGRWSPPTAVRRLRRRAGADPRPPRPRRLARVLLQRRRQRRSRGSASRCIARARGEDVARGRLPGRVRRRARRARSPTRPTLDAGEAGARGGDAADRADQGDARALRRALRPLLLRAHAPRGIAPCVERALESCSRAGQAYRSPTARCGCARPRSATTRTGCSCAPTASRRTWRPISATCWRSASAAMTARSTRSGADHHGYVPRIKAAFAALGGDPTAIEMPMLQFVHLVEGSERAAISKRRGEFITLDELPDEIGVDATRFFMLQRSHDRTRRPGPRRSRASESQREPRLLRPVRARPDRHDARAGAITAPILAALAASQE